MTDSPPPSTPSSAYRALRIRPGYIIALLLVLAAVVLMVSFFERVPIEGTMFAIDWQALYWGLQGGHVAYQGGSVMIAPWSLPVVLPLGFVSMRAGWGLLALCTITTLVLSVPRRRNFLLGIFLLVTSYPALRLLMDGNFEFLVIAGVVLIVYGFRGGHLLAIVAGILLATAKPQETWIFMIVLGVYLLRTWSLQRIFELAMSLAIVVVPALILFGGQWLGAMKGIVPPPGTLIDISLWAGLGRMGAPDAVRIVVWALFFVVTLFIALRAKPILSREKAGMLVAISLLLAPYAAANSYLTPFAVGVIPMWQSRPRLGWLLLVLTDIQILFGYEFMYWNGAYYTDALLILLWGIWCWQIYQTEIRKPESPPAQKATAFV